MKKIFLLITIFLFSNVVFAKKNENPVEKILFKSLFQKVDSVNNKNNSSNLLQAGIGSTKQLNLDSTQFCQILRAKFNSVINSGGKTTIGNYASTDLKDGHLAFNATKLFKGGSILSININGGATDGFLTIFNQNKINSNVGMDFKYNRLILKNSVWFDLTEIQKLSKRIDIADSICKYSNSIHSHDSITLSKKYKLLSIEIQALNRRLTQQLTESEKADINYQIALKKAQADSICIKLINLKPLVDVISENDDKNQQNKALALDAFKFNAISFHWISVGGGLQNNNFSQFKPNSSGLDNQIVSQDFTSYNLSAEFNYYHWSKKVWRSWYMLAGAKISLEDNFSNLTKVELNDTQQYSDSVNKRTVSQNITAYKGDYKSNLFGGKLYLDFYKFILQNDAAIHIYPEVNFRQNSSPLWNAGIGILYSFKDASDKDGKAKLHAELYCKLSDLSNITNSKLSVWERKEFGLRLSIPVSFFNF